MTYLGRTALAVAAAFAAVGCGTSPTAPDAGVPALAVPADGTGSQLSRTTSGGSFSSLPVCDIEAIVLSVLDSAERNSRTILAEYKGSADGCPAPRWSVAPETSFTVDQKEPTRVVVYDDPQNKLRYVDVTAVLETSTMDVSETVRVYFPTSKR